MDDELATLQMYFQKCEVQCQEDDCNNDENLIEGEFWEFKEPERVEAWSLFMIPFRNEMTLSFKFKGAQVYLQISYQTKIKDVEADTHPVIKIKCMTYIPDVEKSDQYHFAVCIDSELIPFNLSPFLGSLDPTSYRIEVKELEKKLDNKEWMNHNGTPLTWKKLCNKIRHLFTYFHTLKGKLEMQEEINKPWSVSKGATNPSRSQSSRPSIAQESGSSRGHRHLKSQAKKTPHKKEKKVTAIPTQQRLAAMDSEVSEVADGSYVDEMENVPHSRATDKKPDYERVSQVYKKFWTTCEDAYVFGIGDKKEIDICQLIAAPSTLNIRSKQENIVEDMVNYLLNIPDKNTKQTLCVMPIGLREKPTDWEEIKDRDFYIINGQHSVEASKFMFDDTNSVDPEEREHFRKWNCFIVWSEDAEKLRCISAYYNRTNHFVAVQPSWATNILGARSVWEAMGRPENPTATKSVGVTSTTRRTVENRRKKETF